MLNHIPLLVWPAPGGEAWDLRLPREIGHGRFFRGRFYWWAVCYDQRRRFSEWQLFCGVLGGKAEGNQEDGAGEVTFNRGVHEFKDNRAYYYAKFYAIK